MTPAYPIVFVCGPIVDRYGFEHRIIGQNPLEEAKAGQLGQQMKEAIRSVDRERPAPGATLYRFGQWDGLGIYAELRGIRPNDTNHNRNAYIGVGFVHDYTLSEEQAVEWIRSVMRVHEDLAGWMEPETLRFRPEFRIQTYSAGQTAPDGARPTGREWGTELSQREVQELGHLVCHLPGEATLERGEIGATAAACPRRERQKPSEATQQEAVEPQGAETHQRQRVRRKVRQVQRAAPRRLTEEEEEASEIWRMVELTVQIVVIMLAIVGVVALGGLAMGYLTVGGDCAQKETRIEGDPPHAMVASHKGSREGEESC